MRRLRRFFVRLLNTAARRRDDQRLADEIEQHLALLTAENIRKGMSAVEARRQAALKFGAVEAVKEEYRSERRMMLLETVVQDVRYTFRMIRKSPGFTGVVVLTMALGVGATTAIFSVVDATLLHPLPYPHPEQLVRIADDLPGVGAQDVGMSEPEWQDYQQSGIFEYVSPAWYDDNNLTGLSQPARVSLLIVAPNYFALLGTQPELGRTFPPADHSPGFTTEVVISDGLWKRMFAGDPNIIGKSIRMDTDLYHIVGVMPPGFHNPGTSPREQNIEIWAATSFYGPPMADHPPRSGSNLPSAIARLKPGLTIATAQSRIDALIASLKQRYPNDYPAQMQWKVRLVPLKDTVVGDVRPSLMLLLAAVGLVLLIACGNVANLLLARASARGREMAIRRSLGADRSRLIRQLLTESLLLSLLGGMAGLAILFLAQDFLMRLVPESLPRLNQISISWGVLLFALGASVFSGVIFGIAPALQVGRLDLMHALKQEGRAATGSGEQARTRRFLVITEFAISLVLMVAAGLLLRSFWDLLNVQLGFNPRSVMAVKTRMPYPNDPKIDVYATAADQAPFFREVLRRCHALPGVEEVAFGDLGALPLGHDRNNQNPPVPMIIEGRQAQGNQAPLVDESIASPEYFHLMGMGLRRGRLFNDLDTDKTEPVVLVNEALARTYWPNDNPLGKHVKLSRRTTTWSTIVGVVANARTESIEQAEVPQIYSNLYQRGAKHLAIFLRGRLDASAIPEQVREQVQSLDPTLPVFGAQKLDETVSAALAQRRFSMEMITLFAVTALGLAALGIYGVISYIVSERTHEIGIRLALGAEKRNILQMVLRQGLGLAGTGAFLGLVLAILVSRLMSGLLYGVKPADPFTFGAVALIFSGVALIACYFPARAAAKVDPMVALRCD